MEKLGSHDAAGGGAGEALADGRVHGVRVAEGVVRVGSGVLDAESGSPPRYSSSS